MEKILEVQGLKKTFQLSVKQQKIEKTKAGNLSTGMKQKVSLVISLVHNPDVIIFDEPTNGLDVLTAKVVTDFLIDLKDQGKTIIVSMGISLTAMFGEAGEKSLGLFCIPLYNSVQRMHGIFSFQYAPGQIVVTMVSNLVYAFALTWVLTRLFNSEKVMFAK